jgi:hypothetical protein
MLGGAGTNLSWLSDDADDYSILRDSAVLASTDGQDFAKVIAMMKALHDGTGIEKTVDVDQVVRYFAVNTFLVNLDSYASSLKHNYYLYEQDGVFQILPWDLNLSFAGFQSGSAASAVNFPIDTPVTDSMENSPLIASLLAVDEYENLYHTYLQHLVTQEITSGNFAAEVARIDTLIGDAVKTDATAFVTYERYQASLPVLVQFAKDRAASITAQLAGQQPSTSTGTLATTVDLGALGSAAGRTDAIAPGQPENIAPGDQLPGGAMPDRTVMQKAMVIIRGAVGGELSNEQKEQLIALGLDEAAIVRLQQMPATGQRPGELAVDGAAQLPFGQLGAPWDPTASTAAAGTSSSLILVAGLCVVLLGAGIVYVSRFRTRRYKVPGL